MGGDTGQRENRPGLWMIQFIRGLATRFDSHSTSVRKVAA